VGADADRGDLRVARQVGRWRRRRRVAVAARAARAVADLDDAVDVRRAGRVAGRAVRLRVAGRRSAVAAIAGAGGRWIVPPRRDRGAACGVQRGAVAVHVAARSVLEGGWAFAISRIEGDPRAGTERHLGGARDRDAAREDVALVVPVLRDDVAL